MSFVEFVQWCFYGLISGALIYGVNTLKSLKESVDTLNISVGRIVEKTQWHEKELERLHDRVKDLEAV
jgi:hypothetical protein